MEHILGQGNRETNMPPTGALPVIRCSKCGGVFFDNVFLLRVLSAIQSPDGQERMIPDPMFRCTDCGTVLGLGGGDGDGNKETSNDEKIEESGDSGNNDESEECDEPSNEEGPGKLKLV